MEPEPFRSLAGVGKRKSDSPRMPVAFPSLGMTPVIRMNITERPTINKLKIIRIAQAYCPEGATSAALRAADG